MSVESVVFHGWKDAWKLSNGACELIVVPAINRVMGFALSGGANLLWVSPDANGQVVPQDDHTWHNLGGDKVWPTQQSIWERYTDRKGWPPPHAFDCAPARAEPIPGGLRLTSVLDPDFGAISVREFVMDPTDAVVRIRQRFEKQRGDAVLMSVWSVTQVRQPDQSLLPHGSLLDGQPHRKLGEVAPECLSVHATAVALRSSETVNQKIGVTPNAAYDNGWVATLRRDLGTLFVQSHMLERDTAYPDGDCHAEIFSANRQNGCYVEMELLSPLRTLQTGEQVRHDLVWKIVRVPPDVVADVEKTAVVADRVHRGVMRA